MHFVEPSLNPIDIQKLQKIQDSFSEAAHLYTFCVDANGRKITELSGDKSEAKIIIEALSDERLAIMLDRVMKSELEEQAVETMIEPGVKVASISTKIGGKPVINWIVIAVLDNRYTQYQSTTTEEHFYKALDFIRIGSKAIISNRIEAMTAEAESRRSKDSQKQMNLALQKSEAMTNIVQLLESENEIEKITYDILKTCSSIIDITHAYIIKVNKGARVREIVGQYCKDGMESGFFDRENIESLDFLYNNERVVAISSDSKISDRNREVFSKYGIKAIIVIPIFINGTLAMHACYLESKKNRIWEINEIKFLNDATKIIQDIIVRRIQKNSLTSSYASLEAILNNVGCGIFVRDTQCGDVLFANSILSNTFPDELSSGVLSELLDSAMKQSRDADYIEIYYKEKHRWYDVHYKYIPWVDGRNGLLFAIYDITDKKQYQKKIEQQANNDFLTGLYNRMCCEKDLKKYIKECKSKEQKGALMYLDLDDFKHINDGLGHQYGDVLLKAISHSFQRIKGIENTCYRMGGDEFVIIVPMQHYYKLEEILLQLEGIFSKPWFLKGADYYCTMSMGIVAFPDDGETVEDLIKKADIAMYEAKHQGKNQIARYSQESGSIANKRLDMEKNMRAATSSKEGYREFEIYYQPLVDVTKPGYPCVGAEALIRWNNAQLGFISPVDFIPLAEYLGLINPIGDYVLRKACETCKRWNENGHPYYKVNVNLSVVQLLQNNIVSKIADIIKETGINPRNLTLEVTESLAIHDMSRMKEVLSNIRKLGARIALDDFGTGYSSLNHIREIPLDVIKVDQTFVRDLSINQYSQSFIKMVAELAEAIDVRVCVEGIEELTQLTILKDMKVKLIQGYYFGKPMPLEAFDKKFC
ncbi:MAG: EAL domain-containing protein [Lachnospiraceae bacterium]|nr:EAL domain-containing protein [Lachnospiraceae bacterium]